MNFIEVIQSGDYLVLDTETTGLGSDAEICQIAIVDSSGKVLLDTLVKPMQPIPVEATAIHGITNEMVKDTQPFQWAEVFDFLNDRNVIVYNSEYDVRLLDQTSFIVGCTIGVEWKQVANFYCAMKQFAKIYGDWSDYHKSYKWKPLSLATAFYGIENIDAHSALSDCLATLAICKAMAAKVTTE